MNRTWKAVALVALAGTVMAGCAVRLGGSKPVGLRTVGLYTAEGVSALDAARRLKDAAADVALVVAPADSAWFRTVADSTGLSLSGPGKAGDLFLGFLAMEPLGDTTHVLDYDGGSVVLQDALYQLPDDRLLDLMAFPVGSSVNARKMVRSLLRYVATDVGATAAVVIAVAAETEAAGDSVAAMLSPAFTDARRCMNEADRSAARTAGPHMRLFYGPEVRISCDAARPLNGPRAPVLADLVVPS